MWLRLVEIAMIVLLLGVSWRIVARDVAANAVGMARWAISILAGLGGATVVFILLGGVGNFVLRMLLADVAGLVVFWLVAFLAGREARRRCWNERCAATLRLPRWIDRTARLGLLLLVWLAMLVVLDLTGRVIQTNSQLRVAAGDTMIVRWFVTPDESPGGLLETAADVDENEARIRQAMAVQGEFFQRFKQGAAETKEEFYGAIGATEVLAQLEAVQQIVGLPDGDKIWLIEQNPELLQLVDHPAMQRIVRDEELVSLLNQVSDGSLSAIYQIGESADVRELLEDPEVRRGIAKINPIKMLEQLREHHRRQGDE